MNARNIRLACENCDNSMECGKVNPDGCKEYSIAVGTNFNMADEYALELASTAEKH